VPPLRQKPRKTQRRSRRGSGAVTLHDVAQLAGVAPITASRAINKPAQVSEDVRKRVAKAVAKTGYVPNLLAGGLASTRSRLVAAVVPTVSGQVFLPMVQALTDSLAALGYQLMLGQSGYVGNREDALIEAIIGRRPDGIVLTGIMHSSQGRKRLVGAGIPVVETWDLTTTPLDMLVGFSHPDVGRTVADYLHGRKRRRLAIVSGNDERAARRTEAFLAQAKAHGMGDVHVVVVPAPTTMRSGRGALVELLKRDKRIDGIFCSSDMLAMGVLAEARARRINVPDQLAVVGFGDLDFAADTDPALTTVHIDATRIGQHAARFIVERAEGRKVEPNIVDVGFTIVERKSA
jgi:LacI family gluconate utilization system Gnt-I transcriptional repressor